MLGLLLGMGKAMDHRAMITLPLAFPISLTIGRKEPGFTTVDIRRGYVPLADITSGHGEQLFPLFKRHRIVTTAEMSFGVFCPDDYRPAGCLYGHPRERLGEPNPYERRESVIFTHPESQTFIRHIWLLTETAG